MIVQDHSLFLKLKTVQIINHQSHGSKDNSSQTNSSLEVRAVVRVIVGVRIRAGVIVGVSVGVKVHYTLVRAIVAQQLDD